MPGLTQAAFEALIPHSIELGLSANKTLAVFRELGYKKRTQAFYDIYRQASGFAKLAETVKYVPNDKYVADTNIGEMPPLSKWRYTYTTEIRYIDEASGEIATRVIKVGSSERLKVGEVKQAAVDVFESDQKYGIGVTESVVLRSVGHRTGDTF